VLRAFEHDACPPRLCARGQNGITPVFLAHEALFQQIRKIAGKLKIIHKLFAKQRGLQLSLGEGRARVLDQIAQQDAYFGGCSEPARLYAGGKSVSRHGVPPGDILCARMRYFILIIPRRGRKVKRKTADKARKNNAAAVRQHCAARLSAIKYRFYHAGRARHGVYPPPDMSGVQAVFQRKGDAIVELNLKALAAGKEIAEKTMK